MNALDSTGIGDSLSAVSRVSPTQQVQNQLLSAINWGEYPPGSKLPSERILCEAFGVSRVSVREALAGLVATGLIEVRQGQGAFVRSRVGEKYAGPFGLYIAANRGELAELLNVRGALDGQPLRALDGHQGIFDAIISGDAELAQRLATEHAGNMRGWVEEFEALEIAG